MPYDGWKHECSRQKARNRRMGIKTDSIIQVKDSLVIDSLKLLEERQKIENMEAPVDTAALVRKNDSIQKAMAAETKPRFIRTPTVPSGWRW